MALFDVRELIKMAIKDEDTGISFYRGLAESTGTDQVKEHCLAISKEEEGHKKRFQAMLDDIGDVEPVEEYAGQYENYVNSLLKSRAFPEPGQAEEEARNASSDAEALDVAMRLEKDTLLFLQEMRQFVSDDHKEYVDKVVNEERKHLTDLNALKEEIA
mgnify:CR=1 FL=1